jgi:hypothetical protein
MFDGSKVFKIQKNRGKHHRNSSPWEMCQIQYNQTLKNKSPKIKPILGFNEKKNKSTNKTQKTDWLTVKDVKVHKWMKKKSPGQ